MDPSAYSFEQNMCPRVYNQLCQGHTFGATLLGVSEIGGTHVYNQFGQDQACHTSVETILETSQIIGGNDEVQVQQDFPVGIMIQIGGNYAAQQEIPVGTIHGEPEIGGTYGIQQGQQAYNQINQGQNFWTTGASMLKVSETGSTNGIQQVYHQLGQGQASCTPVATILEAANIRGPNETRQVTMGTMNGKPVIRGAGIQGECYPIGQYKGSSTSVAAKRQLFKFEDDNKLNNLRSESLSDHHQAFSIPVRTPLKILDCRDTELPEGDEEEEASQTYQNQHTPYAEEQTGVVSDAHNEARPSRKVIPNTRVLKQQNENILSCKGESDPNNLQGDAVSGSLTPDERKRAIDRRYRARVKAKNQKLLDDFESVSKENDELKEKLHSAEKELLLLKNHGQRNVSAKRKAVFELNFDSVENKATAMKMVGRLPDMAKINLNVKKRRLKLKGDFDVEALHQMLKIRCNARLVSKEDVEAVPGPSTSASQRVSAVQLR